MRLLSSVRFQVRYLGRDGRGIVLFAIASGWFLSIGFRTVYPALLPYIRDYFGLDYTTAGLLVTVLWISYGLGQLPGGVLGDRLGEGNVMVASTAIAAITLLFVVTAELVSVLFAATILFGLGTALYGVCRFTALSDIYPERTGMAIGVTMAAGDVGNFVLPPLASFIAASLSWQYGFGFAVPLFVLSTAFLWGNVPNRTSPPEPAGNDSLARTIRTVFTELRRPPILLATVIAILGGVALFAFTSFYPLYLVEEKGLSTTAAATVFGLFFALGVIIKLLAGGAYDWIGISRSLPVIVGTAGIGLILLPWVEGLISLLSVTVLISGLLGNGTIVFSHLTTKLPSSIQGTGLGVLRSFIFPIGALGPVFLGTLADRGLFNEAFLILGAVAGAMVVIALLLDA